MSGADQPTFGLVLGRYRLAVGLTQEELAERAGLSPQAISALERGIRSQPRAHTVRLLAEGLGLAEPDRAVFEAAARARTVAPNKGTVLPTGDFLGAAPTTELVARGEEQQRFRSVLDSVMEGGGQVLLLSGEAGVGKTRLLQELMREAGARSFAVVTGRCYAIEQGTPYYPFLESLGQLVSVLPPQVHAEGQRDWKRIQEIAAEHAAAGGAEMGSAVDQHQLADAVSHLLLLAAGAAPLALLLDDLQWADDGSLKLLQHLAHTTRHAPVLLAGSFRDLQIAEDHPSLAGVLQTLSRERLAERLLVRRLSLEETTTMVAADMGGPAVSEEFASFVYRRTKGIPRLIDGLVRSLGGRLELQGEIGAGSMGRVFRAFDRTTERTVAAKVVLARQEVNLDALLSFQHEGAVLSRLEHPHIVKIYDTFAEEHASCIIMELLDGQPVSRLLDAGPMSLHRARGIGIQIAQALAYAHQQGIVHRDIKPDNVMVLDNDRVKVTDFGIARILQPDTSLHTMATTGMRMGTPLYMAPEQIEGKKVDGRTDIYALGAMLFHLITGKPPFEGSDALAIAVKQLQEAPPLPSSINPAVPADWDALISRALSKDPGKRFQSAGEIEAAITRLSDRQGALPRVAPRVPWAAAAMVLVLVLVATAAIRWVGVGTAHSSSVSSQLNGYLSGLASAGQLSGTVLVATKHGPIFDQGYGYADRAAHLGNGPDTKYADVAITTNVSIADIERLIQFGLVRWDDTVCTYLATCPADWKAVTLRTLLDGTARLPDYAWGQPGNTTQQTLQSCQARPRDPLSLAGTVEYQVCTNLVLGLITEKLEALPWSSNQILQTAAMQNTAQLSDAIGSPERAVDYMGTRPDPNSTYNDFFVAESTVADEYAFDNALFGGRLVAGPYLKALFAPRAAVEPASPGITNTRWGYYWEIGSLFGRRVIFTYAEINRFLSVNIRFPSTGLTVIVLSNDSGSDVLSVAIHAAALASGIRMPPASNGIPVPRGFLGTYRRTFTSGDQRSIGDPGLVPMVGRGMTLTIHPDYVHLDVVGAQIDEYYRAARRGRVELLRYLPANYNNVCQVQPNITPPIGQFRWSLQGKVLVISPQSGNHCTGQVVFYSGRWVKTG